MSFASAAISQELCFPIDDSQKILRTEKECDVDRKELELRKEQNQLKDQRIANLEKELELVRRESEIKDRIIAVKDMEIQAKDRAFNDMKEVADRSLNLAEIGKPKSNWQLQGLLGVAAFAIGLLIR